MLPKHTYHKGTTPQDLHRHSGITTVEHDAKVAVGRTNAAAFVTAVLAGATNGGATFFSL